jgi:hypothetical protein
MNPPPDHLPDWVFWLVVVILPAVFMLRQVWKLYDPRTRTSAVRMTRDDVISAVHAAIAAPADGRTPSLGITERPSARNQGHWTVRENTRGSWWIAQVNDATGEVVDLRRQGVR